jgi:hypothetical protein
MHVLETAKYLRTTSFWNPRDGQYAHWRAICRARIAREKEVAARARARTLQRQKEKETVEQLEYEKWLARNFHLPPEKAGMKNYRYSRSATLQHEKRLIQAECLQRELKKLIKEKNDENHRTLRRACTGNQSGEEQRNGLYQGPDITGIG